MFTTCSAILTIPWGIPLCSSQTGSSCQPSNRERKGITECLLDVNVPWGFVCLFYAQVLNHSFRRSTSNRQESMLQPVDHIWFFLNHPGTGGAIIESRTEQGSDDRIWPGALSPADILPSSIACCSVAFLLFFCFTLHLNTFFIPYLILFCLPLYLSSLSHPPLFLSSCYHAFRFVSSTLLLPLIHLFCAVSFVFTLLITSCVFPSCSYPSPPGNCSIPVYSLGCALGAGSAGLWPVLAISPAPNQPCCTIHTC